MEIEKKKTVSWDKRMEMSNAKWESCRCNLFEIMLSNEAIPSQNCWKCNTKAGLIQCNQCCGIGRLCGACDVEQHQLHPFHDRQYASPDGFLQSIQPTESSDDDGNLVTISKCSKKCYNYILCLLMIIQVVLYASLLAYC